MSYGQEKWDLLKCVTYAMANNNSVKQADIQSRLASLGVKLSEWGRYPTLNFGADAGYNFGRSINPATNIYQTNNVFFTNYQLQTSVTLFNWFSLKYALEASELDKKAADASVDKARDDIALNVAIAYLQALLANEQVAASKLQIAQSRSQLENIRKKVNAGALPELNAIEMEAQLARDSAAFIGTEATYQQNLILLKALLNLDMATPFDIAKPDVASIPVESLADMHPAVVYQSALKNLPLQRANEFRYQAAMKNIRVARSSMYPTVSAFANIRTGYSSKFPDQQNSITTQLPGYDTSKVAFVEVSPGNLKPILSPNYNFFIPDLSYGRQVFDARVGQVIGINLSVPILNNRQLKTNWERSKLNAENIKLQLDQDNLTLQTDIYTAYTNAVNAQQRYFAAMKSVEVSERAFDFSQKRYAAGLLQTIELITNQNNLYRARLDALAAQYEYVFRMKLLEFYKGQGLKF